MTVLAAAQLTPWPFHERVIRLDPRIVGTLRSDGASGVTTETALTNHLSSANGERILCLTDNPTRPYVETNAVALDDGYPDIDPGMDYGDVIEFDPWPFDTTAVQLHASADRVRLLHPSGDPSLLYPASDQIYLSHTWRCLIRWNGPSWLCATEQAMNALRLNIRRGLIHV